MKKVVMVAALIAASYYGYKNYFSASQQWHEGGTLHKESLQTWTQASEANQLATSGDFATALLPKSEEKLIDYAEGISLCISGFAETPDQINNTVSDTAKICIKMICLADAKNCELLKQNKKTAGLQ